VFNRGGPGFKSGAMQWPINRQRMRDEDVPLHNIPGREQRGPLRNQIEKLLVASGKKRQGMSN
jgi:hypothetical protein